MYVNFATNFGEPGCSLLPVSITSLVLFISYLSARKFASPTISTYFSALGYVHKFSAYTIRNGNVTLNAKAGCVHSKRISKKHCVNAVTGQLMRLKYG